MWIHYGRDHTGICLQLEWSRDVHTLSRAVSIEYNDEYPVVNWVKNFKESIGAALMRKHSRWSYENEYRISIDSAAGQSRVGDHLTGSLAEPKATIITHL
jgi:hypothetical protein